MLETKCYDRTWMEQSRLTQGFKQSDVAQAAGCSLTYYNRIEKGFQVPTVNIALRITDFLGLDPHMFLKENPLS